MSDTTDHVSVSSLESKNGDRKSGRRPVVMLVVVRRLDHHDRAARVLRAVVAHAPQERPANTRERLKIDRSIDHRVPFNPTYLLMAPRPRLPTTSSPAPMSWAARHNASLGSPSTTTPSELTYGRTMQNASHLRRHVAHPVCWLCISYGYATYATCLDNLTLLVLLVVD